MKELTKAEELILLTIWRLKNEAYGVAIRKKIKELTGKVYAYGTLYFILDQLSAKELVLKIKGEPTPERGGRGKTFYNLTPNGQQALKLSLEMHNKIWTGIKEVELEEL